MNESHHYSRFVVTFVSSVDMHEKEQCLRAKLLNRPSRMCGANAGRLSSFFALLFQIARISTAVVVCTTDASGGGWRSYLCGREV